MSQSPNKLPSFKELVTGNDTIREDPINENMVSTTRRKDIDEVRGHERRLSASEKKATSKHIERIRNSYQKKQSDCYAAISASIGNKPNEFRRNSHRVMSGGPVSDRLDRKMSKASDQVIRNFDGTSADDCEKPKIEETSNDQSTQYGGLQQVLRVAAEKQVTGESQNGQDFCAKSKKHFSFHNSPTAQQTKRSSQLGSSHRANGDLKEFIVSGQKNVESEKELESAVVIHEESKGHSSGGLARDDCEEAQIVAEGPVDTDMERKNVASASSFPVATQLGPLMDQMRGVNEQMSNIARLRSPHRQNADLPFAAPNRPSLPVESEASGEGQLTFAQVSRQSGQSPSKEAPSVLYDSISKQLTSGQVGGATTNCANAAAPQQSTSKKSVLDAYYGLQKKPNGLMSQLLTSGSFKERQGRSFISKVEKRSDYKQAVPKFEVTPEPKKAALRSSCERQGSRNASLPRQQSSGAYEMIKDTVQSVSIVPASAQPRINVNGRKRVFPPKEVPSLSTDKVAKAKRENVSPLLAQDKREFCTSRPQILRKSVAARDASPSALSVSTTNARALRTFDDYSAGLRRNFSKEKGNVLRRSMNSQTGIKDKKRTVHQVNKRLAPPPAQNKKANDVMQSVRDLASQRQREMFSTVNTVASTVTKKKQEPSGNKIAQLYMKGDQGVKKSKYETTVRQEKAKTAHIARNQARRDVSAPKKHPVVRPRVAARPQRKAEKSFDHINTRVSCPAQRRQARNSQRSMKGAVAMSASFSQGRFSGIGRGLSENCPGTASQKTLEPLGVMSEDPTDTLHGGSIAKEESETMLTSISVKVPRAQVDEPILETAQKQAAINEAYGRQIQTNVGMFCQRGALQSRSVSLSPASSHARSVKSCFRSKDVQTLNKPSLNSSQAFNLRPKSSLPPSPVPVPTSGIPRQATQPQTPGVIMTEGSTPKNPKQIARRNPIKPRLQAPKGKGMRLNKSQEVAKGKSGPRAMRLDLTKIENKKPSIGKRQGAFKVFQHKLGAVMKGYRVRRLIYNVREVRDQLLKCQVLEKLAFEGYSNIREILDARGEFCEMVEFLQSGNIEWLRQGGHQQIMSDRTFLGFEAECMYERMKARATGQLELATSIAQSSPSLKRRSSKLVEQSMKSHTNMAASIDSNMPQPMVFSQNESQETFAHNNYGSLANNSINEDDLDDNVRAIPMSQLVNESIGARGEGLGMHTLGLSQEPPLAFACGSNSPVLKGNIVVGQGLIAGVKKSHRSKKSSARAGKRGFESAASSPLKEVPIRASALDQIQTMPMSSDNGASQRDLVVRPMRIETASSKGISQRGPGTAGFRNSQQPLNPHTPKANGPMHRRDIYASMDANACPQIGSPVSPNSCLSSGGKAFSPLKSRLSPLSAVSKKSKKASGDKENTTHRSKRSRLSATGKLSLNLKKVELSREKRMAKNGSQASILGRRSRGQRSSQRQLLKQDSTPSKNMPFTKKNVGPLRMKAENIHTAPVAAGLKSPVGATKSGEGSVTMTEVLRLISLNHCAAANLDVAALDQASKAQLRNAIGQLMRQLDD